MQLKEESIEGSTTFVGRAVSMYNKFLLMSDPRVADWPLMSSPWPSFAIVLAYLVIVVWWGPKYMAKREKGFNLRRLMMAYNGCMVVYSAYLCYEFCAAGWFLGGYNLGCQPVDWSTKPQAMRMARVCWWFFISKFIELFDTALFVLRKKFELVTFLHVFHHAVMPASWWFGVKFAPGGFGTFHAVLNSFIHFMMYTYYGLAAAGPMFHPYLWWKKYMTTAQIVQFVAVFTHTVQLFFHKECDYPMGFAYWILSYDIIFLFLFANFYSQAYIKGLRTPAMRLKRHTEALTATSVANDDEKTKLSSSGRSVTGAGDEQIRQRTRAANGNKEGNGSLLVNGGRNGLSSGGM